ncbi:MAG: ComEC/Rec2 family competence protein [Gemmatimonadales bacterium]
MSRASSLYRSIIPLAAALACAACGSGNPATGTDTPPTITVAGIADGVTYGGPVAILISIDRGAYQATLDGAPFASGDTVRTPGAHTLTVTAHVSVAVATTTVHFTLRGPDGGALIVRMFNLGANDAGGGGDAILVTDSSAAGMMHVMIDAGPAGANAADPGFVARQLTALHVDTLAILLLTHAHSDHYGGMPAILSAMKVRRFFYNGQIRNLSSYNSVISQASAVADSVIVVSAQREYDLGFASTPAHLTLIPPLATYLGSSTDSSTLINDGSIGARLSLGTFTMLFTGDAEVEANANWMAHFMSLIRDVTVLKVGHHGANNAIFDNGFNGTSTWLTETAPRISLISGNGTTHPRINALNRLLAQVNDRTYCTNVHGDITLRVTRAGDYTVSVERNAGADCVPGTDATT